MREMLQLRAWLVDSEPDLVWRQFVIDPQLSLEQLHTVLQIAFGWQNAHLHQFHERDGRRYGRPHPEDRDVIDERKLQLGQVFDHDQKRVLYEYDFGDSWIHAVELENKVDGETFDYPTDTFIEGGKSVFSGKPRAAICVAGDRNGPPEDCGGIGGYLDILDLLENPNARRSRDQKDLLEWLGDWEPDRFVLGEINQNLGRVGVKKGFGG